MRLDEKKQMRALTGHETGTGGSGVMEAKWSESKRNNTKVTGGKGSVPTGDTAQGNDLRHKTRHFHTKGMRFLLMNHFNILLESV